MKTGTESLRQFYERTRQDIPAELLDQSRTAGHFNVKRRNYFSRLSPYNRRDYYKVCLVIGTGIYQVRDQELLVEKPSMIFSNPSLPSSWTSISKEQSGFYCLFNDDFLLKVPYAIRQESPLFNTSVNSIISLDREGIDQFNRYYTEMDHLLSSSYSYKYDMIRSILQTLMYEGIRLQEHSAIIKTNPADDLTTKFLSLLDHQFPVDSPENPLKLMNPADYADLLNIHVNHLNAVLKKATGKTTREIIHEHVIMEAKTLLLNTNWDAAEIGYSLGFEYPSHFNKYFKQHTSTTPIVFREHRRSQLI